MVYSLDQIMPMIEGKGSVNERMSVQSPLRIEEQKCLRQYIYISIKQTVIFINTNYSHNSVF